MPWDATRRILTCKWNTTYPLDPNGGCPTTFDMPANGQRRTAANARRAAKTKGWHSRDAQNDLCPEHAPANKPTNPGQRGFR